MMKRVGAILMFAFIVGCTADGVQQSENARLKVQGATTNPVIVGVEELDPTGWAKIASEVVGGGLAAWIAIDRALAAHLKRKNAMANADEPTELAPTEMKKV